jgi:hypothetical protein
MLKEEKGKGRFCVAKRDIKEGNQIRIRLILIERRINHRRFTLARRNYRR